MAATKMTFTLDSATVERIDRVAQQLSVPKSQVIRDAVAEFYDRRGRLSESQRLALLQIFDEVVPRIAAREPEDVQRELSEIRQARQLGSRRMLSEGANSTE